MLQPPDEALNISCELCCILFVFTSVGLTIPLHKLHMLMRFSFLYFSRFPHLNGCILTAYFILENNLPLRSALEAKKRIQTEIRTISNDDFGIRRPQCACISVPLGPVRSFSLTSPSRPHRAAAEAHLSSRLHRVLPLRPPARCVSHNPSLHLHLSTISTALRRTLLLNPDHASRFRSQVEMEEENMQNVGRGFPGLDFTQLAPPQHRLAGRPGGDGGVRAGLGLGAGGVGPGRCGAAGRQRVRVQRSKVPDVRTGARARSPLRPG